MYGQQRAERIALVLQSACNKCSVLHGPLRGNEANAALFIIQIGFALNESIFSAAGIIPREKFGRYLILMNVRHPASKKGGRRRMTPWS